ncbi:hypothetical protein [Flavobacterium sp.]|uniref:hypothetical protein n=1 Tax=Flavobacterium sp. TaxID=239 RepID=UPI00120AA5E5|nr:hypothetical protein [Flavobacterium sp.]RZJ73471.1 MAG: hypothetical protein EOO49_01270 [Flavobacterium sp.]
MNKLLSLLCVGLCGLSHAQQSSSPPIASESVAISEYFKADREGIHLHANKAAYLSAEKIWFKGYIIKKQSRLPYPETMNVYVNLLDPSGRKVTNALLYSENSLFNGYLELPKSLTAGVYYLQVYTNYMNNFSEDESSLYPITVINKDSPDFFDPNAIDYSSLDISFFPESGVFLADAANTVAFRVSDCNGNGIPSVETKIKDAKGTVIASPTTDASGYSRFDISETNMAPYSLSATIKGKEYQKQLPTPSVTGITFSINNYVFTDKAAVTIKTNKATLDQLKGKNYNFVIQDFGASTLATFTLDGTQTKQTLSIPSANFSDGLNTVYLVDSNKKKIGERVVYHAYRPQVAPTELTISQKRGDSIVVKGRSGLKLASLSVSVVPSASVNNSNDIYGKLELSGLRNTEKISGRTYFDGFNRKKHYELDNMLMTQSQKYDWAKITASAPILKYDFDKGLTIKGALNNKSVDRANAKVNLNSTAMGLNEFSVLNEKNEFAFDRIMVEDSAMVFFSLFNKKNERTEIQVVPQVSGNNRSFVKPFEPVAKTCVLKPVALKFNYPESGKGVKLDSVVVNAPKKPKLDDKNRLSFNNSMARGYKIEANDVNLYSNVVDFIQNHGYNVSQQAGRVMITRTFSTSFQGSNTPQIFVDNMLQDDHSQLTMYRMDMVDEIYINKSGYGGGLGGGTAGIIRIYLKKTLAGRMTKTMTKGLTIKSGFQKSMEYKNPDYADYQSDGFQTLGALHWIPETATDENGNFRFAFPNFFQDSVKIVIEGIASDGTVISEVRTLQVKQ